MTGRRRPCLGWLVLAAAALVTATGAPGTAEVPSASRTVLERAFTVEAEAYPFEPAPGSQEEPVSVRGNSTRVALVNPPAAAYARAAATDFGLAEGYVGARGPQAEADTSIEGQPRDVTVREAGFELTVRVDDAPSAEASAVGGGSPSSGTGRSRSVAFVDGALVATARAEIQDVAIGPLWIGNGSYDARVSIDGTPGGASAEGRIVLTGTSVNGVPVVITPTGVEVDSTEVPVEQIDALTAQVQQWFSTGGYSDIRLVQPKTTVSEDGTHAEASGGGVYLFFTNNDPGNFYFLRIALLGGRASATIGSAFGGATGTSPGVPATIPPIATPTTRRAPTLETVPATRPPSTDRPPVAAPAGSDGADEGDAADIGPVALTAFSDDRQTLELDAIWPWWWLVVAGATAATGGTLLARRDERLRAAADRFVDRYLRG